jgi:hypothetical protein
MWWVHHPFLFECLFWKFTDSSEIRCDSRWVSTEDASYFLILSSRTAVVDMKGSSLSSTKEARASQNLLLLRSSSQFGMRDIQKHRRRSRCRLDRPSPSGPEPSRHLVAPFQLAIICNGVRWCKHVGNDTNRNFGV